MDVGIFGIGDLERDAGIFRVEQNAIGNDAGNGIGSIVAEGPGGEGLRAKSVLSRPLRGSRAPARGGSPRASSRVPSTP